MQSIMVGNRQRTSAANLSRLAVEAGYGSVFYGTGEFVPFLTHTLMPVTALRGELLLVNYPFFL
jgi:hypothetical protein